MTDIEDFKEDFYVKVKSKAEADGEGTSAAFVKIFTECLFDGDVISNSINPAFFKGTGKHNRSIRIDGYLYDEIDQSMIIVISDYSDEENRGVLTKSDAEKIFSKVYCFIEEVFEDNLDLEESTPAADLADYLTSKETRNNIQKYRIFLLTNTVMSSRIKELDSEDINSVPVELQIWDLNRLYDMLNSDTGRELLSINFRELNGGLRCIEANTPSAEDYKSYLCVISGNTLADIYDKYGGRLLEENVRMFLSNKSGVNKKIRKTIQEEPEKFFAYNNGISVTVRNAEFEERDDGMFITATDDFQIINGGQTTASLSQARYKDHYNLDGISVPMKLTWLIDKDPDKVSQLVRSISYSANSQNKVTDADFFSSHPFHQLMERASRKVYAPAVGGMQHATQWYYERVRGQYQHEMARMTTSEKNGFKARCPDYQKFDKNIISKVRNTWDMKPDVVSKGSVYNIKNFADSISKTWDEMSGSYDDLYFKESVALLILFNDTDRMIPKQDWYSQGGYKGNLVIYSISLFHHLLKVQFKGKDLNLMHIWNKQAVPELIRNILKDLAMMVYQAITDDERPIENVTQWCKREKCWDSVKNSCSVSLPSELELYLV